MQLQTSENKTFWSSEPDMLPDHYYFPAQKKPQTNSYLLENFSFYLSLANSI